MFLLFLVLMFSCSSIYQGRGSVALSVNTDDKWKEEDRGTLFYMRYYASYSYVNPMNLAFFCHASYESFQFLLYCDPRHRAPLCVVRLVWNCHKCAMLTEPEDI